MFFVQSNQLTNESDEDLIDRYKNSQNSIYLDELFQRYSTLVFGVAIKYLKDEASAKDITMIVFEKLITELVKRNIDRFRPWLYQVAKNECLMLLRKQKSENNRMEILEKSIEENMQFEDTSHLLDEDHREKLLLKLEECLSKLREEQITCVRLFYFDNKCYQEVADITKNEIKKVKSYIQNGKRNLKICLEKTT